MSFEGISHGSDLKNVEVTNAPARVEVPLPSSEGMMAITNPHVQGFMVLLAFQQKEAKERRSVEIDFSQLKSPANKIIERDAMMDWVEKGDKEGSFARKFHIYRKYHPTETINPKDRGELRALFERVLAFEPPKQETLH